MVVKEPALVEFALKPFGVGCNLLDMRGQPTGGVQRQIGEMQLGQQGEAGRRRLPPRQPPRIVQTEQAACQVIS